MYYKLMIIMFAYSYASFVKLEYHRLSKPLEIMVDTTNDLAYKIICNHAFHNPQSHDNYAFSPSALSSVLLALYEGSSGLSAVEIQKIVNFPNNLDIIRIGGRDIHRRLRTYFFDRDNPLKGLSLNRGGVKITRQYENILKFYGFDLSADMIGSMHTVMVTNVSDIPMNDIATENPAETVSVDATTSTVPLPINGNVILSSTITPEVLPMTSETSTITDTSSTLATSDMTTNSEPETVTQAQTTESTTEEVTSTSTTTKLPSTEEISPLPYPQNIFDPTSRLFPTRRPIRPRISVPKNQTRIKRHFSITDDVDEISPDLHTTTIFVYVPNEKDIDINPLENSFSNSHDQLRSGTDTILHAFHLNPFQTIQTTFKVYNSILKHGYIHSLKSSVIELELDSLDYNLLLFVPDQDTNLNFLIRNLKMAPSLRLLRNSLKSQWVQAIVPDFAFDGRIYLTKRLQSMGISNIFEPNQADLHPMTEENGIYVKHIEQLINVRIRTRPINQFRRNTTPNRRPYQVHANHPFLFFIVDNEIDVVTMCGCVLNPLNIRIQ